MNGFSRRDISSIRLSTKGGLAGQLAGPHKQVANQNPARAARAIINCPISLGIQFPSSVAGRCWLFLFFLLFLDFLMNMHVVRDTHTNIAFTMYWALPSLAPIQTSENAVLDKSDGIKIKIKRETARANAFERFLIQSFVWQVGKRVFVEIFLGVCSWLWKKLKQPEQFV